MAKYSCFDKKDYLHKYYSKKLGFQPNNKCKNMIRTKTRGSKYHLRWKTVAIDIVAHPLAVKYLKRY